MSQAIYLIGVVIVVAVMLSSYFLGERGKSHGRNTPYESGIKAFGTSQVKYFTHYFLLAIMFVIFDMESVFLYIWASSVREVGWAGFVQVAFFIGMLLLALAYAWSMKTFRIAPHPQRLAEKKP